jgi:C4-dicarboxylate transporter, DctM subunit
VIGAAIAILVGLLALALPVGAAMGILGLLLSELFSRLPLSLAAGEVSWSASTSFILVAIPFFILLGEILLRTGMAERMYAALAQWISWLPGGLMHANVASCAFFAATSGSSVATAATIGTVAVREIDKHGYSERLFLGTLAAGGTLGILIPPSINLIVYGVLTDSSIPQLYLAGFAPGFTLAALFSLTVLILCAFKPSLGGRPIRTDWASRIKGLPDLIPPFLIFLSVIGSIYAGLATATEAAALGVICALAIAAWSGSLSIAMLKEAFEGTMRSTAMVMAILIGAYFLNFVITSIGLTAQITRYVTGLGLSPLETLLGVVIFYLILGCFMETLSMMVATVPIIAPVVFKAGYDPIWFGILVVLLMETAMVTPPVGINLYVVQGVRGRGSINDVIIGTAPFVVTLIVMIGVVILFPQLVLFVPNFAKS